MNEVSEHVDSQHSPRVTEDRATPRGSSRPRRRALAFVIAGAALLGIGATAIALRGGEERAPAPPANEPHREGNAIVISTAFRDAAGIRTTPATSAPLAPRIRVVGSAAFDPKRIAAVGTRAPGIVTTVLRVEGDVTRRGDLLAEIESPALAEAQADMRIANANRRAAELNAERETALLARGLTTAREHEQAVAALEQQRALAAAAAQRVEALGGSTAQKIGVSELRAPVGGVVAERGIAAGQSVGPGVVAFRVGDLDALWVLLRIFERDVQHVRVGDPVEVRAVSGPEHEFHGKVAHVGAVLDPATRATDVRLVVDNDDRLLRPGQSVTAIIHASGPAHVALTVPSAAVTHVDDAPTVFVAESPNRFVVRKVQLGLDGGDRVEILTGVREGEQVVSDGVIALKSELFR